MKKERWEKIEPVLDEALQINESSKREEYVRYVCEEDEKLYKKVRELLHAIKKAKENQFLESP